MSFHNNEDARDRYADSKMFDYDCEEVAQEWLLNNHRHAQAWWDENSFKYSPQQVLHPDFLDIMTADFLHEYEEFIVDEVWERFDMRFE